MNKASLMMTDWFPYLFFLVCLVVTRRVYLTWAWGESCHKTLVLLVFLICLCPNKYRVVLSGEFERTRQPSASLSPLHSTSGGRSRWLPGEIYILIVRKSIFFCNFVQDYSQLLRDILGGTKGHPLVARIL